MPTDTDAGSAGLPRWDLSAYFPAPDSREFAAAHERVGADIDRMVALYDRHDVRGGDRLELTAERIAAFEEVLRATNDTLEQLRLLSAYVHAFATTDARDDTAAALASQLQMKSARVRSLSSRFDAWVASLGAGALAERSTLAAEHAYPLRKAEATAAHQMSEPEEALYAELTLSGSTAWNRLHGDVTSMLVVDVEMSDGATVELPMTQVRNLASAADPDTRRRAYDAELAAWESVSVECAAAINAIKGEANAVNARRGWSDPLDPALHANSVDRPTLEAMQAAVEASLPDWRRYLRAKAAALGSGGPGGGLPWWDLFAPLGGADAARVDWEQATQHVVESFSSYSPGLAGLAHRAFDEGWIDAGARAGKRGGAFCMGTTGGESRVLMNFGHTFGSVSTLAHELGHAYHNTNLGARTPLQRATPMALAETASIFCETLLTQSVLSATGNEARRLAILEYDLQGACQVVVDIHSRFLFETALFAGRRDRVVPAGDLCELMLDAQRRAYGDGLEPSHLHRYMWAVKPHYYSTHFYNWPYTFGLLFGLGLYARYLDDSGKFRQHYDDLLSSTGLDDAAGLARRFGIDIRRQEFWSASLGVLRTRIDDFVRLVSSG